MPTWTCVASTGAVAAAVDLRRPGRWLSDADERRWSVFRHVTDRDAFVAARVLVRCLLTDRLDRSTAPNAWPLVQRCPTCGREHGRPSVTGLGAGVSWAHSGRFVAAAVSTAGVGVDVERVSATPPPLDTPPGTVVEHAWLRWTRMEALVKRGDGDLDTALAWPLDGPPAPGGRPVGTGLPGRTGVLTDVVDDAGAWVASVAADGAAVVVPLPGVLAQLTG